MVVIFVIHKPKKCTPRKPRFSDFNSIHNPEPLHTKNFKKNGRLFFVTSSYHSHGVEEPLHTKKTFSK